MSGVSSLKKSNRAKDLRKIWHEPVLLGVILLVVIALIIFIIYPLASILVQSISPKTGGISLASYVDVLGNSSFQLALKNTLVLGTIVGTLATLIGFVFAYADSYIRTRFKGIFKVVSLLPIVSPPFVLALSAIMLFGQRGLITMRLLGLSDFNIYGLKGLVMVQVMTFFPVSYLMLVGLLKNIDPSIEESARNMGASRWKVFTSTTLPLMLPGIANSFLITFIEVVADFANPMAIGGSFSTLATQIYLQAVGNYNMDTGTATAVILLVLSIGLFVFEKYWIERKSYITITGKAARGRVLIEDKSVVVPINIFCVCVTIFVLAFYLLIPLGSFFKLWGMDYSLTFKHYRYIFDMGFKPFFDTVYLSAIATPLCGLLSMVIAFLVVRKKFIGRGFIEFSSLLAMAVPGTVLGLGYVLAFNKPPIYLTGTMFVIVIAFIVRSLPVGVRSGVTSLNQIDPAIEEAACDLGASTRKVFTSITLPLISPAFFSGLVYTFVRSMTAVSAVIFLVTPKFQLITAQIMAQVDVGRFGPASAYSTILIILVYSAIMVIGFILKLLGLTKEEVV